MIPALMAAGFAAQAIGTGINAYRANDFMKEAQRQLRDLENNPIEPYKASTQLRTAYAGARAGAAAPKGMSMEDVNRFMINQARNENTALANAGKMGYGGRGNLSILNAGLSGMSADMASKSAMMAQQNRQADLGRLQSLSGTYQSLANMNVNANMQAQAAYGRAIQQQRQNISNAWKSLADMGGMAAGYGMMGMGSPKKAPVDNSALINSVRFTPPTYNGEDANYVPPELQSTALKQTTVPTFSAPTEDVNYVPAELQQNVQNPMVAPQQMFNFSNNNAGMSPYTVPGYSPQVAPGFMNYMRSQLTPNRAYPTASNPFVGSVYDAMNSDLPPGLYIK
jgi:hypothetical protein